MLCGVANMQTNTSGTQCLCIHCPQCNQCDIAALGWMRTCDWRALNCFLHAAARPTADKHVCAGMTGAEQAAPPLAPVSTTACANAAWQGCFGAAARHRRTVTVTGCAMPAVVRARCRAPAGGVPDFAPPGSRPPAALRIARSCFIISDRLFAECGYLFNMSYSPAIAVPSEILANPPASSPHHKCRMTAIRWHTSCSTGTRSRST